MNACEIINVIQEWAQESLETDSLFLLGSHGRGDQTGLSDIDIAIESKVSHQVFILEMEKLLPIQNYQFWDEKKIVFWVGPSCLKVDCFLVEDASQLSRYYWTSAL